MDYFSIPKPVEQVQKDVLSFILQYSDQRKYINDINNSSFNYPYKDVFDILLSVSEDDDLYRNVCRLLQIRVQKGDLTGNPQHLLETVTSLKIDTIEIRDGENALQEMLLYSKKVELKSYLSVCFNTVSDGNSTFDEIKEKIEELYKHAFLIDRRLVLKPVSRTEKKDPDYLLIDRNGVNCFRTGSCVQVVGLPKCGKTQFIKAIIASCLGSEEWGFRVNTKKRQNIKVALFDTEMDRDDDIDIYENVDRLSRITIDLKNEFEHCAIYNTVEVDNLFNSILATVQDTKPDIVIIDGLNDLIEAGSNDQEESTRVVNKLNRFAKTCGGIDHPVCLVWILHSNLSDKTSDKAGGHSGSQSTKKVDSGFFVKIDNDTNIISVVNNVHRKQAIDNIYIEFDKDGFIKNGFHSNQYIAQKSEAEKQEKREQERRLKQYDQCVGLEIWKDGNPVSEEEFINAHMSKQNSDKPRKGSAIRSLNDYISSGVIERVEEERTVLLHLKDPSIAQVSVLDMDMDTH